MADSALYFPYIEVPDRPSLTRVLLYWDRLGTIAPWGVQDLSERMRGLVDCELVERVDPQDALDALYGYQDGFLALLDVIGGLPASAGVSRIHREKASSQIWRKLSRDGFVYEKHPISDGTWMAVDERVADLYMAYLALSLAGLRGTEAITDKQHAFAIAVDPRRASQTHELDQMRSFVLANVLPAPIHPVPPQDLAAFKAKHWDDLRAFRLGVEEKLLMCLSEPDSAIRQRKLTLAAEQLEQETIEVEARMARHRWPTARGVLCAGLAGALPTAKAIATSDPWEAGAAVAPLVVEVVNSLLGAKPSPASQSPTLYAALARREFDNKHV
jgi:hypothetical protein